MTKRFSLTEKQEEAVNKWLKETVYPEVIAAQRKQTKDPSSFMVADWDAGYPYAGAIGGGVTYLFTPTSVGTIEKVRAWGQELDVTEYELW